MRNPESVLENETHKIHWGFENRNRSPIPGQETRSSDSQKKKKKKKERKKEKKKEKKKKRKEGTSQIMEFAIPVADKVKIKKKKIT